MATRLMSPRSSRIARIGRVCRHEAEALENVRQRRAGGGFWNGTPHLHHHQADDHRDVAHGVREEAPSLADHGHQDSGDRGPDDSRSIEHGGIQGDRVHQVFLADHVDEECLPGGNVERVRHAQQRRQHQDVPHLHLPRERQRRQEKRQHHGCRLGPDHDPLPVVAVGHRPAQWSHQQDRNLARESHRAQQQRGAREPVDQPRQRHGLHPRAGHGDELPAEEELEVAVLQGTQGRRKSASRNGRVSEPVTSLPLLCRATVRVPVPRCRPPARSP